MSQLLQIFVVDDNLADLYLAEEVFAAFSDQVTVTTYPSGRAVLDEATKIRGLEIKQADGLLVGSVHGIQRQMLVDF